jgi:hypothetical protein
MPKSDAKTQCLLSLRRMTHRILFPKDDGKPLGRTPDELVAELDRVMLSIARMYGKIRSVVPHVKRRRKVA